MVPVGLNWPGGPGGPELQLTDFAASWLEHNRFEINSEVAYPFNASTLSKDIPCGP